MQARRQVLIGLAAAGLAAATPALAAKPRKRLSKKATLYQDCPKDIRSCASCTLFVRPDRCKVVVGKVSPDGWCKLYDMAD
ncbi:MAG TPA: hypothetical protein VGM25_05575 [Caulobacteraceae bacterium]|jgi:hypothetical protein